MTTTGAGVFFDGATSQRRAVDVALGDALYVTASGHELAAWPLEAVRELAASPGVLRLTRECGPPLARLEIRDPALAAAIRAAAPGLSARTAQDRALTRRVLGWSVAAVASLALVGLYGVPALADRIAPLLPGGFDSRLGAAVDGQLRAILPTDEGEFDCGTEPGEEAGRRALDELSERFATAAALPVPLRVVAVRSDIPNAFALPGGYVYLFDGLIRKAESADELAGVLAHEIGHVAGRDGTRRVLQASGASFLLGFALGDVVGGGAILVAARELTAARYSRKAESDADAYAVRLMRRTGGDPRAFGALLARLSGETPDADADEDAEEKTAGRSALDYLSSHPQTAERRRAIDVLAGEGPTAPLMEAVAFSALKTICGAP